MRGARMRWEGVLPAITTPFARDGSVAHAALARHARFMIANGCAGIVALGSLGEGAALSFEEKEALLRALVAALGRSAPVVAGIGAPGTREAVRLARAAESAGCMGLMVLPPYVYAGDARETRAHVAAVIDATGLSCMLYNNPAAYRIDFLPEPIADLAAAHANLHAVKESSGDVRRVTAIRALLGDRLRVLVGLDDAVLEGVRAGASGWVAGLVNAFPDETVGLFNHARAGREREADRIYRWFLPLLRMDTVPKFVQLIKLAQQEVGRGNERVRPPRLPLKGPERADALRTIRHALSTRSKVVFGPKKG